MDNVLLAQLGAVFLLVITGWLAGAYEAALQVFSVSRLDDLLAERNRPKGRVLNGIIDDAQVFRVAAAFVSALCYGGFLLIGAFCWVLPNLPGRNTPLEAHYGWLTGAGALLLAMAILRALSATTGELLAERMVARMAIPAWLITRPFYWLSRILFRIHRLVARGAGVSIEKTQEQLEDEVIAAVSDGELAGIVNEGQREMIERVFDFVHTDVADIFTPRTAMRSLEVDTPLNEAIASAIECGHSRLPVYEGTRDNILGVFHVRDVLSHWGAENPPTLRSLMRQPFFVPETKNVVDLLQQMQRGRLQFAIVLDEYGGTAGIVTIEDVLEEIVGDIHDEFDKPEDAQQLKVLSSGHLLADGQVHVSDINEALEENLLPEDDDYETVAGFVLDNLGHIPKVGEEFNFNHLRVKVVSADERRVRRVEIIRPSSAAVLN